MADYSKEEIKRIELKWQEKWVKDGVYKVSNDPARPKYYVLDMFPYPSGAGLHVGHPLGYIASDIVSRYKRIKGFNVLHPMGFDAFGLPAEQYAIQTGQHPAITTAKNIETYKRQLRQIGFSYDWDREVQTCDPAYYKWTQWIFTQLFNAWYNKKAEGDGKAEPIATLIAELEKNGNKNIDAVCDEDTSVITAAQWNTFNEKEKEDFLQKYRIAYLSETMVNWCAALGTVLSNDEVKDGVSERGGYPVERIKMMQWSMRITAYAERLLKGLDTIDWPEPVKEMQRNWIGKSTGCELDFKLENHDASIRVFTTRIDTIYGVTFMVIAPEHELVAKITTAEQRAEVEKYIEVTKNRSERERMSEVKRISGAFTGAYVINPFNNEKVPVWIADYVLAGYGTGAVMAVPSSDTRDYAFAKHFNLPIIDVLEGPTCDITKDNFEPKSGKMINSDILNGLDWKDAIEKALQKVEAMGIGIRKVNFRMRDAIFGRQRYWGEPFPVYYKDGLPQLVPDNELPVTLPEIDEYKPTETGEPPLARAKDWGYRPSLTPNPSPGERGLNTSSSTRAGFETSEKKYWHILKSFSKENRQNQTESESLLWEAVRNNQLGHKIRRQHAIGIFIADFVCLDRRLVIEVDGDYHLDNKEYDAARTHFLKDEGFSVIRFTNDEVKNNLSGTVSKIKSTLDSTPSIKIDSPSPAEKGSGDEAYPFELTTMPGWAGSSWYWFRYMDPKNEKAFAGKEAIDYWQDVDLYMGGSEHATGHLLYSRFWCKALKDLGYVKSEEPFKKLINQGHIQGVSKFIYRATFRIGCEENGGSTSKSEPLLLLSKKYYTEYEKGTLIVDNKMKEAALNHFKFLLKEGKISVHQKLKENYENLKFFDLVGIQKLNIKTQLADEQFGSSSTDWVLNQIDFKTWCDENWKELNNLKLYEEDGKYICGSEVEKMSKTKYNVVNPEDIVNDYGADTLRMYEMFLGPLELSKPWNTNGIDGVYKFLRRFWNLFHGNNGEFAVSTAEPTRDELKILHKTLKKIEEDIERFSFNTSVSEFMICCNELGSMKCNKRSILEPLVIALSPFAPHIAEELWQKLGYTVTILKATFPSFDNQYLVESSFSYPISINGKVRAQMDFALDMPKEDIEKVVMASEIVQKWTEGKPPKKVIIVQGKIVNVVL